MSFELPTKVYFGNNSIENLINILSTNSNVLIITGKNSVYNNDIWSTVENVLKAIGVKYTIFNEIEPNPSFETIDKGFEFAHNQGKFDYVIGLGGGSAMDAAKGIALLLNNPL